MLALTKEVLIDSAKLVSAKLVNLLVFSCFAIFIQ